MDIDYWMNFAKSVENSKNPCYSRKIGVVIVDPETGDLVSIGHNGPPKGSPPCDDRDYLKNVVYSQLTPEERTHACHITEHHTADWFANKFSGCGKCPRKIVGAESGKRLELCTCAHAEHNAVVEAHRSVVGCWMICHCGVPCIECCKTIINAGIKTVICLSRDQDYSPYSSRWMLEKAGIELEILASTD